MQTENSQIVQIVRNMHINAYYMNMHSEVAYSLALGPLFQSILDQRLYLSTSLLKLGIVIGMETTVVTYSSCRPLHNQ